MLLHTNQALSELSANNYYGAGVHYADHVRAGLDGLVVGETQVDYALHDPSDVMQDSIMAEATGLEYVPIVIPQNPMHLNLVVDRNINRGDMPDISDAKAGAIDRIQAEIRDSRPDGNDTVSLYYIDGDGSFRPRDGEEQIGSAADLLDVCSRGLTFVVSDFSRLHEVFHGRTLERPAIGVKINHTAEWGVPAGYGVIDLGGGRELNTDNPAQLNAFNARLAAYHAGVRGVLGSAGVEVANVVVQPWITGGLDIPAADAAIAHQIKSLR